MKHIVLTENAKYNYTLIVRLSDTGELLPCEPFVVAWKYYNGSWAQGHYFQTLESAFIYMHYREHAEEIYKAIKAIRNTPFDIEDET